VAVMQMNLFSSQDRVGVVEYSRETNLSIHLHLNSIVILSCSPLLFYFNSVLCAGSEASTTHTSETLCRLPCSETAPIPFPFNCCFSNTQEFHVNLNYSLQIFWSPFRENYVDTTIYGLHLGEF
jgi:hypothetical protein